MAALVINGESICSGVAIGTELGNLLLADDIQPGAAPSYQLCKTIYLYHPLGRKMAEAPITLAQSQEREVSVPKGPEMVLVEAFEAAWRRLKVDSAIFNTMRTKRIYGIAAAAIVAKDWPSQNPVEYGKLYKTTIKFNVLDPLNTSGSLVLNQNPNAVDFQKPMGALVVQGQAYHPSRTCVVLNEEPIYINFTTSAFGFVGRSVYQRALFPLKSFINSMITDDMVVTKAGLLIATMKQAGSIADNLMTKFMAFKRNLLKEGKTNNVLSMDLDEKVETLNMQNLDGAYGLARKNILENIAVSDDMPAKLLNSETFAEGFGEGTEDAKMVARYVDRIREEMDPLYEFFTPLVQHVAWNQDFYKTIQKNYPEQYGEVPYATAFYEWAESFKSEWPNFLIEPESELVKVDDVKLRAVIALLEILLPNLDPKNRVLAIEWASDNFNELKLMFKSPLVFDTEALEDYDPQQDALDAQGDEDGGGGDQGHDKPVSTKDNLKADNVAVMPAAKLIGGGSASVRALMQSVAALPDKQRAGRNELRRRGHF